jgi:hypothetical protein
MIFSIFLHIFTVYRLRNKQKDYLISRKTPCTTSKYEYSILNIEYSAALLSENCRFV